jgi:hypothetical protein
MNGAYVDHNQYKALATSYGESSIETIQEQQRDSQIENPTCIECGDPLTDNSDGEDTCYFCLHVECEHDPCEDCYENAIDKAHDAMDQDR